MVSPRAPISILQPRAQPVQPEDEEVTAVPDAKGDAMQDPATEEATEEQREEPEKEALRAIPVDDPEETGDEIEMTPGQ
jgi:hypothetical protein